jgi:hypothetical protein
MPVKACKIRGKKGYKFGKEGKCYVGKGAKEKALKQGRAIHSEEN